MEESFIDLLVENLKIEKMMGKLLVEMSKSKDYNVIKLIEKNQRQLQWFSRRNHEIMKKNGIEVPEIEGTEYREGMAVEIINREDVNSGEVIVQQVLEPIIMKEGKVLRVGKIIIGGKE